MCPTMQNKPVDETQQPGQSWGSRRTCSCLGIPNSSNAVRAKSCKACQCLRRIPNALCRYRHSHHMFCPCCPLCIKNPPHAKPLQTKRTGSKVSVRSPISVMALEPRRNCSRTSVRVLTLALEETYIECPETRSHSRLYVRLYDDYCHHQAEHIDRSDTSQTHWPKS